MEGDVFVDGRRLPKAPEEAPSMWLAVHDTDFAPRLASLDGPCWKPTGTASKWREDAGNWTFSGLDSETELLSFAGEVTNHLAYNGEESHFDHEEATRVFVGDLLVECPIAQFSGEGSMGFQWEFRGSRVTATVSSTGHVELVVSEQREEDAEQEGKTRQVQGISPGRYRHSRGWRSLYATGKPTSSKRASRSPNWRLGRKTWHRPKHARNSGCRRVASESRHAAVRSVFRAFSCSGMSTTAGPRKCRALCTHSRIGRNWMRSRSGCSATTANKAKTRGSSGRSAKRPLPEWPHGSTAPGTLAAFSVRIGKTAGWHAVARRSRGSTCS